MMTGKPKLELGLALHPDGAVHPYDLGQMILTDLAGQHSEVLPRGRCYMVFIEVATVYGFIQGIALGSGPQAYQMSNGIEWLRGDHTRGRVTFEFKGLSVQCTAQEAARQVGLLAETCLARLAEHEDQADPVISDLRDVAALAAAVGDL